MYPICSTLRRFAATSIYVTESMCVDDDSVRCVYLERPASYLDLASMRWSAPTLRIPIFSMRASGASEASLAISLSKRENKIAEELELQDAVYTLVLAPEEQRKADGVLIRDLRYVVVRGVFRATKGRLVSESPKKTSRVTFGKAPKGSVTLD